MMKKECRVVIYKEGLLGSLFFGEAKADPDKMSQFLSSYTREGWEVKTMSVERRRAAAPPCSGRGKRIFSCSNAPSDSLRLVYTFKPGVPERLLSGPTDIALLLHVVHALLAGADHASGQHGKTKALIKRNFIGDRIDKNFAKGKQLLPDGQHQLLSVTLPLTFGDDRHIRQIAAPGTVADGSRHGNQLTVLIAKPAEGALAERLLQLLNIALIQSGLGDNGSHPLPVHPRDRLFTLYHHHTLASRRLPDGAPEARSSMPRQDMPGGKANGRKR